MLLEGVFPAVTTPFYPNGQIYFRKLEQNMARYSLTAVTGFVVLGSTGEAVMLNDEESRAVLRTARMATAPDKVLLAGVGRESVTETLRLAEFAAAEQYDAVLVRTPNFYEPQMSAAAMLNYYRVIADHSPLPVLIYSIPKFTHYDIPVALIAELARHPNIIGIKDSSGSVERIAAIVAATQATQKRIVTVTPVFTPVTGRMLMEEVEGPGTFVSADQLRDGNTALAVSPPRQRMATRTRELGFQALSGAPETFKASMDAGASGAVLAMGACAPQACQEIYTAWKDRDPALAGQKQDRLTAASGRVGGSLGIAGVKYACELNGYYGGRPRLPLLPLTAAEKAEVEILMSDLRS
jgi:4-hydroxy-2-oxoglutarate aldolase